ncbi:hypothetical protein [Thiobacillus sp.]|uniref:hypothetical protein n=1 Tax=Thiobacillus sp. TaxID=924 RepID=UPI0025E5BF41|nr:hypothetical protein [Thiobacillus sp.]MBT9540001.1 hypothetical protein [Thiobacillus sp.]
MSRIVMNTPFHQSGLSIGQNGVIPAEAGIQRIEHLPRKRNSIMVLSASRGDFSCWIPAFAGMTG